MDKGSSAMLISRGLAGPKISRNSRRSNQGNGLIFPCHRTLKGDVSGSPRLGSRPVQSSNSVEAVMARSGRTARCRKLGQPGTREKPSTVSVPRTDTGIHGGESQGLSGATDVREFGKLVPYVRKKGCLLSLEQVAVSRTLRLSSNNTGDCKSARTRTVTESCPVRVSEHPVQWDEGPVNGGGNYDPLKVA